MSASYKGAIDPITAALIQWLQEPLIFTHAHRGVITPMMSAIDSPNSALHVSCGPRVLRSLPAHGRRYGTFRLDGAERIAIMILCPTFFSKGE